MGLVPCFKNNFQSTENKKNNVRETISIFKICLKTFASFKYGPKAIRKTLERFPFYAFHPG